MSMPRVGSKHSNVLNPPTSHRAMPTFCWLPPDRRRTSDCTRVSICKRLTAVSTRRFSPHGSLTEERLQPVGRDEHQPGTDGVGRVTKTARIAGDQDLAGLRPANSGHAIE